jgi:DNA-binding NtrC family response regulator
LILFVFNSDTMNKKEGNLLIVDDNEEMLLALQMMLTPHFQMVTSEKKPDRILDLIRKESFDVILLDMNFKAGVNTGNEGLFWLRSILDIDKNATVVFITAYGDVKLAVQSIKEGAADFIQKSWDEDKILSTVMAAYKLRKSKLEIRKLKTKQKHLSESIDAGHTICKGSSSVMEKVYETIEKVGPTDANILILGESGTGKEIIAREIHKYSKRAEEIFVQVDVASLPESLFESELFGHEKGAFTDAKSTREGRFEIASGGTLFLDEIGNLSMPLQTKLLNAIQNRHIFRIGGNKAIPVDIRLICATNKPLYEMVEAGSFREDLLYRINTIQCDVPPLRERTDDIPDLANFFLSQFSSKYRKEKMGISKLAMEKLKKVPWYGNVRELQHTIEKAVIMGQGEVLKSGDFDFRETPQKVASPPEGNYNMQENERRLIADALNKFEWNLSRTSRALGINRSTLYEKIKKYGL